MKKLGKLQINSEKIMKNEELVTLRGGYDGGWCGYCWVYDITNGLLVLQGPGCGTDETETNIECNSHYNPMGYSCYCS